MTKRLLNRPIDVAAAASMDAARLIRSALAERGTARVIAATGSSQREFLSLLTATKDIDWHRVELFHLDEYIGLSPEHPASMQRYIQLQIVNPTGITRTFLLDGTREDTWRRAAQALSAAPADLAFSGIGENGHLAFNEPPADFTTEDPFVIVDLAAETRIQQVRERWFESLEDVPWQAITMSIRQLLKTRAILCIATGRRKSSAVQRCFASEIVPEAPASALRLHQAATLYLDSEAAELLPS